MKVRFFNGLFAIAQIDVQDLIKVFYERLLSATINNYDLVVTTDCLVARPLKFNTPNKLYFFSKRAANRSTKKAEGTVRRTKQKTQMLLAMLIAQEKIKITILYVAVTLLVALYTLQF